jgi:hypothetical protein
MSDPEDATRFHDDGAPPDHTARATRTSVMLTALIEKGSGRSATRHRVRDLSVGGMRIDNAAGLQADMAVRASVGALQAVEATVKWVRGGFAGLAFDTPIDLDEARSKAAVATRTAEPAKALDRGPPAPTAGWIQDLRNPYRK